MFDKIRLCSEKVVGVIYLLLIVLFIFIVSTVTAEASTYYVATTGSDSNTGTISDPFASIARAYTAVSAGDTIYVREGTYYPTSTLQIYKSGTSGNTINLYAYPGETPTFDGSNINMAFGWFLRFRDTSSWWHVKGLEFTNNAWGGGVYYGHSSHDHIFENNNIHHSGSSASWLGGVTVTEQAYNISLINNDAHHIVDSSYESADGFGITTTGSGIVLTGNRAWRNSDDGYDFFCTTTATNSECIGSILRDNWAIYNGLNDSNINYPSGDGNGFKLGGVTTAGNQSGGHTLTNNVAWGNYSRGFDENCGGCIPNTLHNNTSWDNQRNYVFQTVNHTLVNNLSHGNLGDIGNTSNHSYNSWNLPVTVTDADFISLDDSCAMGPRQSDGSLPDCDFLKLATSSDLIDKGTNVGLTYSGTAPDLGAYELSLSDTTSALPDVVVTSTTYNKSTGKFTSVVKNQGTGEVPAGQNNIGVGYTVDGVQQTWGSVSGPLAAGASVNILTTGPLYAMPLGIHTVTSWVDDVNRFVESDENNNKLTQSITVATSLPDVVVTSTTYNKSTGKFTSVVKNQGTGEVPAGQNNIGVGYTVDGVQQTWGSVSGPLAAGASVTINTTGPIYKMSKGTHAVVSWVDDVNRFVESDENNNKLTQSIRIR